MQKFIALIVCWCYILSSSSQSKIVAAEYFIDIDPGYGNAVNIPITTPAFNIPDLAFNVSLAGSLTSGTHLLFIRSRDDGGQWSITNRLIFFKSPGNIVKAEYFFDADPGFGNAIDIPLSPGEDVQNISFSGDLNSLSAGAHQLFIRSINIDNIWSITSRFIFYKSAGNIVKAEYYFDNDPGFDNATDIPLAPGVDVQNISFSSDISSLSAGAHELFIRSRNNENKWSVTNRIIFFRSSSNIVKAEYFFDTDPGFGKANDISILPGVNVQNITFSAGLENLKPGTHELFIRSQNSQNKWSITNRIIFLLPPTNITEVEYFIDTDPGIGNAVPIAVNPSTNLADFMIPVNISGLTIGDHNLYIRSKAESGWSITNVYSFAITDPAPAPFINVNALTKKVLCAGDNLKISYDARGTFNTGNTFNVELSDATGSFANPMVIGSLTDTLSRIINSILPSHIADGNLYRIRVSSTSPVVIGATGNDTLTMHDRPYNIPAITGRNAVNAGFSWNYDATGITSNIYNWIVSGGIQTAGTTTPNATVQWGPGAGAGGVGAYEINQFGCKGDTGLLAVNIYQLRISHSESTLTPCRNNNITVSYNLDGAYDAGNVFNVELSDSLGNFTSPTTIGSVALAPTGNNITGVITAQIPNTIGSSNAYRIRVSSTLPVFIGDTSSSLQVLDSSKVYYLAGNLTLNGNLDLAAPDPTVFPCFSGKIVLGNYNLVVNGSILNYDTSHFIITNGTGTLQVVNALADNWYPVGTTLYNPNFVRINNTGAANTYSVSVKDSVQAGVTTGQVITAHNVNKTWFVSESNPGTSNATVTLHWAPTDELASFDRTVATVGQYQGGAWSFNAPAPAVAEPGVLVGLYSLNRTGVTTFSALTVTDTLTTLNTPGPIPSIVLNRMYKPILNSPEVKVMEWLNVSPNPARDAVQIKVRVHHPGKYMLNLIDMVGHSLKQKQFGWNAGDQSYRLGLNNIAAGTYLIELSDGKQRIMKKIIKVK